MKLNFIKLNPWHSPRPMLLFGPWAMGLAGSYGIGYGGDGSVTELLLKNMTSTVRIIRIIRQVWKWRRNLLRIFSIHHSDNKIASTVK